MKVMCIDNNYEDLLLDKGELYEVLGLVRGDNHNCNDKYGDHYWIKIHGSTFLFDTKLFIPLKEIRKLKLKEIENR